MSVEFALFLSPDGIALAHRQEAGHWALIGDTALDVPDLRAALRDLRKAGEARAGADFPTLLILPDDQILYTTIIEPTGGPEETRAAIEGALDGLTPYPVADLAYDWRPVEDGMLRLAVVANETLDEAESFARDHGFHAVGFAASPPAERFPGVALFRLGPDADGLTLSGDGLELGPDTWTPPAEAEKAEAMAEPAPDETEPEEAHAEEAPDEADEVEPEADMAAEPEPAAPAPEESPADAPETTHAEPAPEEAREEPAAESAPDEPAHAAAADETAESPAPDAAEEPAPDAAEAASDAETPAPEPASEEAAAREPEPVAAGAEAEALPSGGPMRLPTGFGARRGKAEAPRTGPGSLVAARQSRFGFGGAPKDSMASAEAAPRITAPEQGPAAPAAGGDAPAVTAPPRSPAARASSAPGPRLSPDLAARLGQVRSTLTRSFSDADAGAGGADSGAADAAVGERKSGLRGAIDRAAARISDTPQSMQVSGVRAEPRPTPSPASAVESSDAPIMGGLLARKTAESAGPSFRVGLILTLILLLILALVAVWSALFLPDSSVARWLGLGREPAVATAPGPDLPAPEAALETPGIDPVPATSLSASDEALLPDIDADLDLAETPPAEEPPALPTREEAEALYAASGIWPLPPEAPSRDQVDTLDELYMASIDPVVAGQDAYALAAPVFEPGADDPGRVASPAPFGTTFSLGPDGLVLPTPEGAVTADGVRVFAGTPPVAARPRPGSDPVAGAALDVATAVLGTFRPTARPDDLIERRERQVLGGFTLDELASVRPALRPPSVQQIALAAREAEEAAAALEAAAAATAETRDGQETVVLQASALAVASSRMPRLRPADIDEIVQRAARDAGSSGSGGGAAVQAASASAGSARVQPSIPSNASVSRAATMENTINLRQINLIGVTGTPANRRALVRLPSGRFVRVAVGDRIDGGRVAAIGESTLQYVKNGRNITLEVPSG